MMKQKIALDSVFHLRASLSLFSFCWGGLHNWAETYEKDTGGKERLYTTQVAGKKESRGQDGFCRKPGGKSLCSRRSGNDSLRKILRKSLAIAVNS